MRLLSYILCFVLGFISLFLLLWLINGRKMKIQFIKKIGVMNFILIIIGIVLMVFTITMIDLFKTYGQIPDTLVTAVFGALAGECGIMGWIKTNKEKVLDRKWRKEDEQEMNER